MKHTKRRVLIIGAIALGFLALLVLLLVLGGPLAVRLGIKPVCLQGDWPHVKMVSCARPPAGVAVVTPWPLPAFDGETPIPVIVDDDGSPDGVIALLYLLDNPLFEVKAVTVSYGEAHPELFAGHLRQLLAGLGRSDIPVGAGRDAPLAGNNAFPEPWRQASDTFWGISLPGGPLPGEPVPAAELIVQTLRASDEPMAVFVTGAHTNLAGALRLDPGIVAQIRDVYVMGGSIHAGGNIHGDWSEIDNEVAEWNIWVDPMAADEVLEAGLPLHIIPLDATRQVVWTESDAVRWASSGSAEGALAAEILRMTLRTLGRDGGMYVWDLVAVEAATDARLCPEQLLSLDVLTTAGPEQGQTVLGDGAPNAAVCLAANAEQMRARAAETLRGAGTHGARGSTPARPAAAATQEPTVTPVPPTVRPEPSSTPEAAASGHSWRKVYGAARSTISGDVLVAGDGGLYVVGTTNLRWEPEPAGDVYLLRTDAAGQVLWEKTYGGEGYDTGQAILETGNGTLLIAGTTTSFGADGIDAYLLEVDQDGRELWSTTYGGPLDENVHTVRQTPEGDYVVAVDLVNPNDVIADPGAAGYGGYAGRSDLSLFKVDGKGTELWSRTYDSEENVLVVDEAVTSDGALLLLGQIMYFPDADNDMVLLSLDGEGGVTWTRTWEEGDCSPSALVDASDGNSVIAASCAPLGSREALKENLLLIKIDAQGEEIWQSSLGDPDLIEHEFALARTLDGGYITAGDQTRSLTTQAATLALLKVDENGWLEWQQAWPGSHTMISRVLAHPDGGFVIAGGQFQSGRFAILLVKTDSRGRTGLE